MDGQGNSWPVDGTLLPFSAPVPEGLPQAHSFQSEGSSMYLSDISRNDTDALDLFKQPQEGLVPPYTDQPISTELSDFLKLPWDDAEQVSGDPLAALPNLLGTGNLGQVSSEETSAACLKNNDQIEAGSCGEETSWSSSILSPQSAHSSGLYDNPTVAIPRQAESNLADKLLFSTPTAMESNKECFAQKTAVGPVDPVAQLASHNVESAGEGTQNSSPACIPSGGISYHAVSAVGVNPTETEQNIPVQSDQLNPLHEASSNAPVHVPTPQFGHVSGYTTYTGQTDQDFISLESKLSDEGVSQVGEIRIEDAFSLQCDPPSFSDDDSDIKSPELCADLTRISNFAEQWCSDPSSPVLPKRSFQDVLLSHLQKRQESEAQNKVEISSGAPESSSEADNSLLDTHCNYKTNQECIQVDLQLEEENSAKQNVHQTEEGSENSSSKTQLESERNQTKPDSCPTDSKVSELPSNEPLEQESDSSALPSSRHSEDSNDSMSDDGSPSSDESVLLLSDIECDADDRENQGTPIKVKLENSKPDQACQNESSERIESDSTRSSCDEKSETGHDPEMSNLSDGNPGGSLTISPEAKKVSSQIDCPDVRDKTWTSVAKDNSHSENRRTFQENSNRTERGTTKNEVQLEGSQNEVSGSSNDELSQVACQPEILESNDDLSESECQKSLDVTKNQDHLNEEDSTDDVRTKQGDILRGMDSPISLSDSDEASSNQNVVSKTADANLPVLDGSISNSDKCHSSSEDGQTKNSTSQTSKKESELAENIDDDVVIISEDPEVISVGSSDEDEAGDHSVSEEPKQVPRAPRYIAPLASGSNPASGTTCKSSAKKTQWVCHICGERNKSLNSLKLHVRRVHNLIMIHRMEDMKCKLCSFTGTWQRIKEHIIKDHETPLKWYIKNHETREIIKLPPTASVPPGSSKTQEKSSTSAQANQRGEACEPKTSPARQHYLIKRVASIQGDVQDSSPSRILRQRQPALRSHTVTSSSSVTSVSTSQRSPKSTPTVSTYTKSPRVSASMNTSTRSPKVTSTVSTSTKSPKVTETVNTSTKGPYVYTTVDTSKRSPNVSTTVSTSTRSPKVTAADNTSIRISNVSTTVSTSTRSPNVSTTVSTSTRSPNVSTTVSTSTRSPNVSTTVSTSTRSPNVSTTVSTSTRSQKLTAADNTSTSIQKVTATVSVSGSFRMIAPSVKTTPVLSQPLTPSSFTISSIATEMVTATTAATNPQISVTTKAVNKLMPSLSSTQPKPFSRNNFIIIRHKKPVSDTVSGVTQSSSGSSPKFYPVFPGTVPSTTATSIGSKVVYPSIVRSDTPKSVQPYQLSETVRQQIIKMSEMSSSKISKIPHPQRELATGLSQSLPKLEESQVAGQKMPKTILRVVSNPSGQGVASNTQVDMSAARALLDAICKSSAANASTKGVQPKANVIGSLPNTLVKSPVIIPSVRATSPRTVYIPSTATTTKTTQSSVVDGNQGFYPLTASCRAQTVTTQSSGPETISEATMKISVQRMVSADKTMASYVIRVPKPKANSGIVSTSGDEKKDDDAFYMVKVPVNNTNSPKKFMVHLPISKNSSVKHAVYIVQPPAGEADDRKQVSPAVVRNTGAAHFDTVKTSLARTKHIAPGYDAPQTDGNAQHVVPLEISKTRGDPAKKAECLAHLQEPPVNIHLLESQFKDTKVFQAADLIKVDDRVQYECARCKEVFPQLMLLQLHHIDCTVHPPSNKVLPIVHIPTALLAAFFTLSISKYSSACVVCKVLLLGNPRNVEDQQDFCCHLANHAEPQVAITSLDDTRKLGILQTRMTSQQAKEWVDHLVPPFKMWNKPTSAYDGSLGEYVCTKGILHRESVIIKGKRKRSLSPQIRKREKHKHKKHKKHKRKKCHDIDVSERRSKDGARSQYQSNLKTAEGCEGEWIEPGPKDSGELWTRKKSAPGRLKESIMRSPSHPKLLQQGMRANFNKTSKNAPSKTSQRLMSVKIPGRRSLRGMGLDFGQGLMMLPMTTRVRKKTRVAEKKVPGMTTDKLAEGEVRKDLASAASSGNLEKVPKRNSATDGHKTNDPVDDVVVISSEDDEDDDETRDAVGVNDKEDSNMSSVIQITDAGDESDFKDALSDDLDDSSSDDENVDEQQSDMDDLEDEMEADKDDTNHRDIPLTMMALHYRRINEEMAKDETRVEQSPTVSLPISELEEGNETKHLEGQDEEIETVHVCQTLPEDKLQEVCSSPQVTVESPIPKRGGSNSCEGSFQGSDAVHPTSDVDDSSRESRTETDKSLHDEETKENTCSLPVRSETHLEKSTKSSENFQNVFISSEREVIDNATLNNVSENSDQVNGVLNIETNRSHSSKGEGSDARILDKKEDWNYEDLNNMDEISVEGSFGSENSNQGSIISDAPDTSISKTKTCNDGQSEDRLSVAGVLEKPIKEGNPLEDDEGENVMFGSNQEDNQSSQNEITFCVSDNSISDDKCFNDDHSGTVEEPRTEDDGDDEIVDLAQEDSPTSSDAFGDETSKDAKSSFKDMDKSLNENTKEGSPLEEDEKDDILDYIPEGSLLDSDTLKEGTNKDTKSSLLDEAVILEASSKEDSILEVDEEDDILDYVPEGSLLDSGTHCGTPNEMQSSMQDEAVVAEAYADEQSLLKDNEGDSILSYSQDALLSSEISEDEIPRGPQINTVKDQKNIVTEDITQIDENSRTDLQNNDTSDDSSADETWKRKSQKEESSEDDKINNNLEEYELLESLSETDERKDVPGTGDSGESILSEGITDDPQLNEASGEDRDQRLSLLTNKTSWDADNTLTERGSQRDRFFQEKNLTGQDVSDGSQTDETVGQSLCTSEEESDANERSRRDRFFSERRLDAGDSLGNHGKDATPGDAVGDETSSSGSFSVEDEVEDVFQNEDSGGDPGQGSDDGMKEERLDTSSCQDDDDYVDSDGIICLLDDSDDEDASSHWPDPHTGLEATPSKIYPVECHSSSTASQGHPSQTPTNQAHLKRKSSPSPQEDEVEDDEAYRWKRSRGDKHCPEVAPSDSWCLIESLEDSASSSDPDTVWKREVGSGVFTHDDIGQLRAGGL